MMQIPSQGDCAGQLHDHNATEYACAKGARDWSQTKVVAASVSALAMSWKDGNLLNPESFDFWLPTIQGNHDNLTSQDKGKEGKNVCGILAEIALQLDMTADSSFHQKGIITMI